LKRCTEIVYKETLTGVVGESAARNEFLLKSRDEAFECPSTASEKNVGFTVLGNTLATLFCLQKGEMNGE
jgi:hypothetical protein